METLLFIVILKINEESHTHAQIEKKGKEGFIESTTLLIYKKKHYLC